MWRVCLVWLVAGVTQAIQQDYVEKAVDVTYYPGVTNKYKAALRYEELRRFLLEERQEIEREEEVVVRLMNEENQPAFLSEPVEFAMQKRLVKQLRDGQYLSQHNTANYPRHNAGTTSQHGLATPSGDYTVTTKKHRYLTHQHGFSQTTVEVPERDPLDVIHELEEAFQHPKFVNVPNAVVTRLLDINSSEETPLQDSNSKHHRREEVKPKRKYTRYLHNTTIPSHLQSHSSHTNQDQRSDSHDPRHRGKVLALMKKQKLISPEDFAFLFGEENQQNTGTFAPNSKVGISVSRERQDEYDEDYEYDV